MSRFLICTSDKRSWKKDRKIIFLGLWCLKIKEREEYNKLDYIFSNPYGLKAKEKYNDKIIVDKYRNILLKQLVKTLNNYHGIKYDSRLWNIVIGHWLKRFIQVSYNRFHTLERCFTENKISGFTLTDDHYTNFIPNNSNGYLYLFNDEKFNNYIFSLMLKKKSSNKYTIDCSSDVEDIKLENSPNKINFSSKFFVINLFNLLNIKANFFYISTYLPQRILWPLSFSMFQIPSFFYTSEPTEKKTYDLLFRETKLFTDLEKQVPTEHINDFLIFINSNILKFIPASYLELFDIYHNHYKKLNWPQSPSTIFTSNNFDTDDVFKIYASRCIKNGAHYFVGQHGNNYGTSKYLANDTIEEKTSNSFISWGWQNKSAKVIKGFYFKNFRYYKNNFKKKSHNKILIITLPMLYQLNTWDDSFVYNEYFCKLNLLLEKITNLPFKNNFLVRLHPLSLNSFFDESVYLRKKFTCLLFDDGRANIEKLYKDHSLVVHTYDSSGIFETLSKNIPTLILITDGFKSHNKFGKELYQILKHAGLLFFSSQEIFRKILEIDCRHREWWDNKIIQDARKKFLYLYAKESNSPVKFLRDAMGLK